MVEMVATTIIAVTVFFPKITVSDKNTGKVVFTIQGLLALLMS